MTDWWTQEPIAKKTECSFVDRLTEMRLISRAKFGMAGPNHVLRAYGYGTPNTLLPALHKSVPTIHKICEEITVGGTLTWHFAWDTGYVTVEADSDGDLRLLSVVEDARVHKILEQLCEEYVHQRPTKKGTVFAVISTPQGLELHQVGAVDAPLRPSNYSGETVQGYEHVIKCMASPDPCGRLVLFEGPPGTGKSYMIRALAGTVEATFVLVGASLVGEISGPEVLPVLLQARGRGPDKQPVVLILEDADAALVKRERGDLCRISDVLNLGDGLLGELVDVRIIATSNAGHMDLDPAVARPGRMCRHVHIGALGSKAAASLYQELVGSAYSNRFGEETTLADVYRAARLDGWAPPRRNVGGYRPGDYR